MCLEDHEQGRGRLYCRGISGLAERFVDDEMRVEIWCDTLQYATPRGVASPRLAGVPEVCADGVVCRMCAFGSGGRLGPIIALSHRCPAIARS